MYVAAKSQTNAKVGWSEADVLGTGRHVNLLYAPTSNGMPRTRCTLVVFEYALIRPLFVHAADERDVHNVVAYYGARCDIAKCGFRDSRYVTRSALCLCALHESIQYQKVNSEEYKRVALIVVHNDLQSQCQELRWWVS